MFACAKDFGQSKYSMAISVFILTKYFAPCLLLAAEKTLRNLRCCSHTYVARDTRIFKQCLLTYSALFHVQFYLLFLESSQCSTRTIWRSHFFLSAKSNTFIKHFQKQVIRRLRDRNEPIRLFGESDYEAFQRLRKLEIMAPDINKGLRNDFKVLWYETYSNCFSSRVFKILTDSALVLLSICCASLYWLI